MKTAILIPARYASTRFPGKPLAMLGSKPVIQHVIEACIRVTPNTFVATDDERIYDVVSGLGYNAIMTSPSHQSGTDRIEEAAGRLPDDFDVIVNVQGDEPFINPEHIKMLTQAFGDESVDIATLATPCLSSEEAANPNNVKVVCDVCGNALYFSRSRIPHYRDAAEGCGEGFLRHVGVYAYRRRVLSAITRIEVSPLEKAERLEQLRWLQNAYRIRVVQVESQGVGIDTPEDLRAAEKMLEGERRI